MMGDVKFNNDPEQSFALFTKHCFNSSMLHASPRNYQLKKGYCCVSLKFFKQHKSTHQRAFIFQYHSTGVTLSPLAPWPAASMFHLHPRTTNFLAEFRHSISQVFIEELDKKDQTLLVNMSIWSLPFHSFSFQQASERTTTHCWCIPWREKSSWWVLWWCQQRPMSENASTEGGNVWLFYECPQQRCHMVGTWNKQVTQQWCY